MSLPVENINDSEEIRLGSGDLFVVEYDGNIPDDGEIEKDENQAGNIKGGATLEYATESQTVEDDMGRVKRTITTKEDVKFKTGLITWITRWLEALIPTARVEYTAGHRKIKIGGLKNGSKKKYLYRFVHTKPSGKKVRVTVTGKNTGAIAFAFVNDNPQQVDAEITAESLDKDGTLVIFDEEVEETAEASSQDASGDDAGTDTVDGGA